MVGDRSSGLREGTFSATVKVDEFGGVVTENGQSGLSWLRFTLLVDTLAQPSDKKYKQLRDEGAAGALMGLAGDILQKIGIPSMSGIGPGRVVTLAPPGVDLETKGIVGIYQGESSECVKLLAFSMKTGALETVHVPIVYGFMQTVWNLRELDGLVRALHLLDLRLRPEWLSHASTETLELIAGSASFRRRFHALQRLGRYEALMAAVIKEFVDGVTDFNSDHAAEVVKYADVTLSHMLIEHSDVSEYIRSRLRERLEQPAASNR